jgi:hypothetical protein
VHHQAEIEIEDHSTKDDGGSRKAHGHHRACAAHAPGPTGFYGGEASYQLGPAQHGEEQAGDLEEHHHRKDEVLTRHRRRFAQGAQQLVRTQEQKEERHVRCQQPGEPPDQVA